MRNPLLDSCHDRYDTLIPIGEAINPVITGNQGWRNPENKLGVLGQCLEMRIAQRINIGLKDTPPLADPLAVQINQADIEYILIFVGVPVECKGLQNFLRLLIGFRL